MMPLTLQIITEAIGQLLKTHFPHVTIYNNPIQQGVNTPCFFIIFMPSNIKEETNGRFMRDFSIDVVYLEELNPTDTYDRYTTVAEFLDEITCYLTMPDGKVLATHERKWFIDPDALHYQFHVKCRVSITYTPTYMYSIDKFDEEVKHN